MNKEKKCDYKTPNVKAVEIELEQAIVAGSQKIDMDTNNYVTETWEDINIETGDVALDIE